MAEKLNQAALPIIDYENCSKPEYWWDTLRPSMVCAGYESPDELKSACQVRKTIQKKKKRTTAGYCCGGNSFSVLRKRTCNKLGCPLRNTKVLLFVISQL